MLNIKQRESIEKACINLLTLMVGTLVIGPLVGPKPFQIKIVIIGIVLATLFYWLALWINRKRKD